MVSVAEITCASSKSEVKMTGPVVTCAQAVKQKRSSSNRICAWCGKEMGWKEGIPAGEVTHGICDTCLRLIEPELAERRLKEVVVAA